MRELRFTILGCGSSGGVPRIGGDWGKCDPENWRNRRTRCSLLVQLIDGGAVTTALIDTSPDLRQQLLATGIGDIDGVVYTHWHADHVNGLDDLRVVFLNRKLRIPIWADRATRNELMARFRYAFVQIEGSSYPPILDMHDMDGPVVIRGAGGDITLNPFSVTHGSVEARGFRIGGLAYLPDVSDIGPVSWSLLKDLDCWILDALRRMPHPSHVHLEQSLAWIEKAAPKRAILTNMHTDLDYDTLRAEAPVNVEPAHDGMTISYRLPPAVPAPA